jgi:hypothetical protein
MAHINFVSKKYAGLSAAGGWTGRPLLRHPA